MFSKITKFINEEKENEAVQELINLYYFLKELIEDKKYFSKLIALLLKNEYQKIISNPSKFKLLNFILNDKDIIYHNYQLIKKEISIENTIEGMKNNLNNLKKKYNKYKELLFQFNNEYLDEINFLIEFQF